MRFTTRSVVSGALAVVVLATAASVVLAAPAGAQSAQSFFAVNPARVLDSRDGTGGPNVPFFAGDVRNVQIAGLAGVPAEATAVALNVTVVEPATPTYLTVWPSGTPQPTASNLNAIAGQTVANLVIVGIGANGQVSIFNQQGASHIVADVTGWFAGGFQPVGPTRVVDSREGWGTTPAPLGAGEQRDVNVTNVAGIPANATAVAINVTVVDPTATSYLTVWPAGSPRPTASNINMVPGQVVPNQVVVGLGPGGTVSVFNFAGSTNVVMDVAGYFTGGFNPVVPGRVADTREGQCGLRLGPGEIRQVGIVGAAGVPAGAAAVALNVTVTNPTAATYLTVWPNGAPQPLASNLNVVVGTVPNMTVVGLGADGRVAIYNFSGSVDIIVDVTGYFDGAGGAVAAPGCVGDGSPPGVNLEGAAPASEPIVALGQGARGEAVAALQRRLLEVGLWVPGVDGGYGTVTAQAVLAFQKSLNLPRTGNLDAYAARLLAMQTLRVHGESTSGDRMEVDLSKQLLYLVRGGRTVWTVNTSTGTGNLYTEPNQLSGGTVTGRSITPTGTFRVYSDWSNGWQPGALGELYRPKYFVGGVAVHGAPRIPSTPASHGCVRVTTAYMDTIWHNNWMPIGSQVWVHN